MTRYRWIGLCLMAASIVPVRHVSADSIWDRREPRSAYLFMDTRARRVGDQLTVKLNETTGATNTEQRKLTKDTAASGKFNFAGKTTGVGSKSAAAAVSSDTSSDRSFNGSAQFQSSRQLLDDIPVTIMEVLPNGYLVVEGERSRTVSNETRVLRVSGVVRPYDIDITNSVSSQVMGKFKVRYEGGGPESRFTNQGWLGRSVNRVWPY